MKAKKARKITDKNKLSRFYKNIKETALMGRNSISIYDRSISADELNKLKELGYSLELEKPDSDGMKHYNISW